MARKQNTREIVNMNQATDTELLFAGKFAGADEVKKFAQLFSEDGTAMMQAHPAKRAQLIEWLAKGGYTFIRIDPNNRLDESTVFADYDVAEPLQSADE